MMSDSDSLLRWLRLVSARLHLRRTLDLLGWLGSGLSAVLSLYAIARLLLPAVVLAALIPLLLLTGVAVLVGVAWRRARRPTHQEAAAATDRAANLSDEIASAYWFSSKTRGEPIVSLLLSRAASRVRTLDARTVFPLGVPASLWTSAALAVLAAGLLTLPAATAIPPAASNAHVMGATADAGAPAVGEQSTAEAAQDADADSATHRAGRAWSQMEALAQSLPMDGSATALQRAVAARDRQAARQAAQTLRTSLAATGTAARPEGEQLSAELAQGILERLQSLLAQDGAGVVPRPKPDADQPTARLTQQLREDISDAQRRSPGQQSQGETALNTLLRAMSRNSWGEREAVSGEGETAQEGGRSNMSGGAMGRRVGVSRAGASDDEAPGQGDPEGDAPSDPVLGAPTTPLEARLQQARVDGDAASDEAGTEEDFYAATQGQAAAVDYAAASGASARAREAALRAGSTPFAYDRAVKRYSLSQHRRDAPPPGPQ
jgi:hypothetical protein